MTPATAQARRYYHHVLNGGALTPEDVGRMVEYLEEANRKQAAADRMAEAVQQFNAGKHLTIKGVLDALDAYMTEVNK